MHIVAFDSQLYATFEEASSAVNGLAVVAIVFQIDREIPVEETILYKMGAFLRNVEQIQIAGNTTFLPPFPVSALLNIGGNSKRYYRYEGSLTTPPCTENVYWTVIAKPVAVKPQQVSFWKIFEKKNYLFKFLCPFFC